MSATGHLFEAEADLRAAAENYVSWENASNRTPELLNKARLRLREAARKYSNVAAIVNRKTKKELP